MNLNLRVVLAFLVVQLFSFSSYSIESSDSLRSVWENPTLPDSSRFQAINYFYSLHSKNIPDSSLALTDYHYQLAKEKNSYIEMVDALGEKAFVYYQKGETKKSLEILTEGGRLADESKNPRLIARIYGNLGVIYAEDRMYLEAFKAYSKALEICLDVDMDYDAAGLMCNIGIINNSVGNYELAITYFEKSLAKLKTIGREENANFLWLSLGAVYYEMEDFQKAIDHVQKSIEISEKIKDKFTLIEANYGMAENYFKLNDYEKALEYCNQAISLSKDRGNESKNLRNLTLLAQLTFESDPDEATRQAENIVERLSDEGDNSLKQNIYELLYKCYKEKGQLNLSLQMHEEFKRYSDSSQKESNGNILSQEAIKKEFEQKLQLTKLEGEKKEAALKMTQRKRTFFIAGAFLLAVVILLLFFRAKNIKDRKLRDKLLQEIEDIKKDNNSKLIVESNKFHLDREKIELSIKRKLNETDWKVLNILLEHNLIPNKEIAEKAFMSVDGIGSSLRRMYGYFEIKETKYKKILLIGEAVRRSKSNY